MRVGCSDEDNPSNSIQQVIGVGHTSNLSKDLPKWNRSKSEFEGFDDAGGSGGWMVGLEEIWRSVGQGTRRSGRF